MARLIVEEAGASRAFKLGDGVVTIGSGEGARLKLTSPDVADVHLELELAGGDIRLRPRPGVTPPNVGGSPAAGEVAIAFGQTIQVGGALLRVEKDEAVLEEVGAAAPAPAAAAASPRRSTGSAADRAGGEGAPRRRGKARAKAGAPRRRAPVAAPKGVQQRQSVVERAPRERKESVPSWMYVAGTLAVVLVGGLIFWRAFQSSSEAENDPGTQLNEASVSWDRREFVKAEMHLDRITDTSGFTAEQMERYDQLMELVALKDNEEVREDAWRNGTRFKDTMLDRYAGKWLQGDVREYRIPLFLKRCSEFELRWPDHPDLDDVHRQRDRWRAVVSLDDPLTWAAIEWEVEYVTGEKSMRDYRTAFRLLDEYEPFASDTEQAAMGAMRGDLVQEREAYFMDEMQLARHHFENKTDTTRTVQKLVGLVQDIGDPEMENQAARDLVAVFQDPTAEGMLAGYREFEPFSYDKLVSNSIVRDYARQIGLE